MNRLLSHVALGALTFSAVACSKLVGVDPSLSSMQRDKAQRDMARPPVARGGSIESVVMETDIGIPLETFSKWFTQQGAPSFGSFLVGTPTVPGVARTELLTGTWNKVGDRRRIVFIDGFSAVEEITVDRKPGLFQYEVWNLTNRIGQYTSYAVGELEFTANAQGTHVRWTYSFHPKRWPDGLIIRSFIQNDYRQFLNTALATMRENAVADLAAKPGSTF